MKAYDATATIHATPETIWSILIDAPKYSEWDSGVERVEGRIAPGEKIKVISEANRAFPVTVTEVSHAEDDVGRGHAVGAVQGSADFSFDT